MVALFVDGNRVGSLADAERLIPELLYRGKTVELRDDVNGWKLGTLTPEPICPWEPTLTREEIDRRCATPGGSTLREFFDKMGWEWPSE